MDISSKGGTRYNRQQMQQNMQMMSATSGNRGISNNKSSPGGEVHVGNMQSSVDGHYGHPVHQHQSSSGVHPLLCHACHKPITERFMLKALDKLWHEDCLKCSCCECRLGEVGSKLYTKHDMILCKRDYLRMFGTTGICSACSKQIPAFEMVMRAKGNNFHLDCFACERCKNRFCVGDRFYLVDNHVLCEMDMMSLSVKQEPPTRNSWKT